MPSALTEGLKLDPKAGTIAVELIAHRRESPGSPKLDEWFIRRSPPIRVELVEPFIQWRTHAAQATRIPFRTLALTFGGEEKLSKAVTPSPTQRFLPVFDTPPRLTVTVERYDEKAQTYKPYVQRTVEGVPEQIIRAYRFESSLEQSGTYRYAYRLEGTTNRGRFSLDSPWFGVNVRYCWECVGLGLVVLLVMAQGFSRWSATLKGQITVRLAGGKKVVSHTIRPVRVFNSAAIDPLKQAGAPQFTLAAKRLLFVFRKQIQLKAIRGKVTLDRHSLSQGESLGFRPQGQHTLRATNPDDSVTEIEMTLRV